MDLGARRYSVYDEVPLVRLPLLVFQGKSLAGTTRQHLTGRNARRGDGGHLPDRSEWQAFNAPHTRADAARSIVDSEGFQAPPRHLGNTRSMRKTRIMTGPRMRWIVRPAISGVQTPRRAPCDNRAEPCQPSLERIMPDLPSGTVTFLFTDVEGPTRPWERNRAAMAVARSPVKMVGAG